MECLKCGYKNPEGSSYCEVCYYVFKDQKEKKKGLLKGQKLEPAACPKCGYKNKESSLYCAMCYETLRKEEKKEKPKDAVEMNREKKKELWGLYEQQRERVDANPDFLLSVIKLADVCRDLGQDEEALMYYKRAINLNPGNPYVVKVLKSIYSARELEEIKHLLKPRIQDQLASVKEANWKKRALGFLGSLFAYPIKKEGLIIIIGGTIFLNLPVFVEILMGLFGIGRFLAFPLLVLKIVAFIIFLLILPGYMFSIIESTALGKDELPDWPDFSFFWSEVLLPFFQIIALFLIPVVLGSIFRDLTIWIILLSLFYYPMALLILAVGRKIINAINPVVAVTSIFKIWRVYLPTVALFYILYFGGLYFGAFINRIPLVGAFLATFFLLYIFIICSRLVGCLYRSNYNKLAWI